MPPFPPWSTTHFTVSPFIPHCTGNNTARLQTALSRLYSLPPSDIQVWTDGSVPSLFGPGGVGVYVTYSKCNTSNSLSFSSGPIASSFTAETFALKQGLAWCTSHLMTCKFQSVLFLTDSQSALSILSSAPSYLLPESLWNVWSLASSFSNNTNLSFQWVPRHAGLPGNRKADLLAKTSASLPTDAIPSPLPQLLPKPVIPNTAIGDVTSPTLIWTSKSPKSLRRNFFFLAPYAVSSPVFAAMATVFFYLHIFTGSVGRRILIVVPVDTLYRTSIISSSTVLLLKPFSNLSLAPFSLFSIYGPDLGVWPDCWVSAEFLRAPIPRKGSGSTTSTTTTISGFMHITATLLAWKSPFVSFSLSATPIWHPGYAFCGTCLSPPHRKHCTALRGLSEFPPLLPFFTSSRLDCELESFLLWAIKYCSAHVTSSSKVFGLLSFKYTDSPFGHALVNCSHTINSTTPSKDSSTLANFTHLVR